MRGRKGQCLNERKLNKFTSHDDEKNCSPSRKKTTANIQTWGRVNACPTSCQLNLSSSSVLLAAPSSFRCATTYAFSFSLKKRACAGERGRMKKEARPNTTVKRPSRMKIHAQPGLDPIPFILIMPYARIPENAPDSDAVEKKAEILQR